MVLRRAFPILYLFLSPCKGGRVRLKGGLVPGGAIRPLSPFRFSTNVMEIHTLRMNERIGLFTLEHVLEELLEAEIMDGSDSKLSPYHFH